MNEMTEERAGELIRTKGEFNQASPPNTNLQFAQLPLAWEDHLTRGHSALPKRITTFRLKITNRVQGATVQINAFQ
jgi:hypothetical protein